MFRTRTKRRKCKKMRLLSKIKRGIAQLLAVSMLILCGCGSNVTYANLPKAARVNVESSKNEVGARFVFTLEEYTERLNATLKELGADERAQFEPDSWNILSDHAEDDHGVQYKTYFYASSTLTYTAAVEADSKKVFNLGCGCPAEVIDDPENEYHDATVWMAAVMTIVAGGYRIGDLDRLYGYFDDLTEDGETKLLDGVEIRLERNEDTAVYLITADLDNEE